MKSLPSFFEEHTEKNFLLTCSVGGNPELKDWYNLLEGQVATSSGEGQRPNSKQRPFMYEIKSPG